MATDKGGMVYAAAELAAQALIAKPQRRKLWIAEEREYLLATKGGPKAWRQGKWDLGRSGSDDEVLIHWARRRHADEWRAKRELGERVHEIAAEWAAGRSADVGPDEEGYIDALEKFWRVYMPETDRAEFVIVNPFQFYGGRPDWYGTICFDPIDNVRTHVLLDFKTGKVRRWELALQCAAYLHGDGTYEVVDPFQFIPLKSAFDQFCNALDLYIARRDHEQAEKAPREDPDDS